MIINEIKIDRILNPTSINLGDFVINPYRGCEYACQYCYVRSNKSVCKRNDAWGEYVDVRINCADLLEKEIDRKKPQTVLIGSTTECFQPVERKYRLTRHVLEILNKKQVEYVLLTRSPDILDCIDLLERGYCKRIYFTVNSFDEKFKSRLEPDSPDFQSRDKAIQKLVNKGISVIPYFSPVLPFISIIEDAFTRFRETDIIEFECLNFQLKNINDIIASISSVEPSLNQHYRQMVSDKKYFDSVWDEVTASLQTSARNNNKKIKIYGHEYNSYFCNIYEF